MLPTQQHRLIEDAKFSYSSLDEAFGKRVKTIGEQGKKQDEVIQFLDLAPGTKQ